MLRDHFVSAHSPKTLAEMQAAHKARQSRFAAAGRRIIQKPAVIADAPAILPIPDRLKPLWMFGHIRFDHHEIAYEKHCQEQRIIAGHRIKRYIRDRAYELGSSYSDITGPFKTRKLVTIRDKIIWEIKTEVKPGISYPELGKLFGRDHTSIIASVNRTESNFVPKTPGRKPAAAAAEAIMEAAR